MSKLGDGVDLELKFFCSEYANCPRDHMCKEDAPGYVEYYLWLNGGYKTVMKSYRWCPHLEARGERK